MNDEMLKALKYLRLGGLLAHWDEYLALARKQNFSHVRLLEHILAQECQIKSENARQIRLQRARIPDPYVMETFPFDRQPKLDKKRMLSLYDAFDFLAKKTEHSLDGAHGMWENRNRPWTLDHSRNYRTAWRHDSSVQSGRKRHDRGN